MRPPFSQDRQNPQLKRQVEAFNQRGHFLSLTQHLTVVSWQLHGSNTGFVCVVVEASPFKIHKFLVSVFLQALLNLFHIRAALKPQNLLQIIVV